MIECVHYKVIKNCSWGFCCTKPILLNTSKNICNKYEFLYYTTSII